MQPNSPQRYLLRNTGVVLAGLVVYQVLQTAGLGIASRLVTNRQLFGELSVMLQILGISGLFLNAGLNSALTYFVSKHGAKVLSFIFNLALLGSGAVGVLTMLMLMGASGLLAQLYHVPALAIGLMAGSAALIFISITNVCSATFAGLGAFTWQAIFMAMATLLNMSGLVVGVILGRQSPALLPYVGLGMALAALSGAAVGVMAVHRTAHVHLWPVFRRRRLASMLRYGLPTWGGNIAKSAQQPFLVIATGTASLVVAGYLSNGVKIVGFLNIVTWAFNVVALPFLAAASYDAAESRLRGTLCFRYNNLVLFPLTLLICCFPRPILQAVFGARYATAPAGIAVILLALGVLFSSVARLGGTLLAGFGRPRANFWTMAVSGGIVFGVTPLVEGDNPLLGPGAYLVGWMLAATALGWFLLRDGLPINWWYAFGEPLVPTLVGALPLLLGQFVAEFRLPLLFLGLTVVIAGTWLLTRRESLLTARLRGGHMPSLVEDTSAISPPRGRSPADAQAKRLMR
jgi:O-antigen/teichoic acid export membrane protein